jgi:hypothetical protein
MCVPSLWLVHTDLHFLQWVMVLECCIHSWFYNPNCSGKEIWVPMCLSVPYNMSFSSKEVVSLFFCVATLTLWNTNSYKRTEMHEANSSNKLNNENG